MPEDKPTESKPRSKQFVKYQDLSKEELVKMLMRINKRLSRISRELREVTDILYYGMQEGQNSGYRGKYGKKPGRQRRSEGEDEDVDYE